MADDKSINNNLKYVLALLLSSTLGGAGGSVIATRYDDTQRDILLQLQGLKTQIAEYKADTQQNQRSLREQLEDLQYRVKFLEKKTSAAQ